MLSMETSINFYKNSETGEIFVIETNWQGDVIASCGPLEAPLQTIDIYELTTEKNTELQAAKDKLILSIVATEFRIGPE